MKAVFTAEKPQGLLLCGFFRRIIESGHVVRLFSDYGGDHMPLTRVSIENYKSVRRCDISVTELSILIGENGTGKTSILEAMLYFYNNLTNACASDAVFDENNRFSNEVRITLFFDFSEFVKISKSNSDEPDLFGEQSESQIKYSGYYKTILSIATKSPNHILPVTLTQIKGKGIQWDYPYEDRLIFRSLFPFFFVDARSLDVTEWGYIWDILGELSKVSHEERKKLELKIHEILIDENKETSKKLKGITAVFNDSNVSVKSATSKEFAMNLSRVYFSGETIHHNGKQLGYYSAGTNSVKYIELMLKSIDEIAKTKLKEPIILIDEPEISLHPLYMDELSDVITNVGTRLRIIISTHSARLTKNLISDAENISLYNVKLVDRYSHIQRMKRFIQYSPESKYRVTDDHINSYFSRAILFVEGETELELFANPYLRALFPKLKYIDVFQAMSQTPILNIMNPRLSRTGIPFICLIDMDKAIGYDKSTKKLSLKGEYFKSSRNEKLLYKSKHDTRQYVYHLRKRIEGMAQGLHIHYYMPYLSCEDSSFSAFCDSVHDYLLAYNVFTLKTTIEGCLINKQTANYALDYLRTKKKLQDFNVFQSYVSSLRKRDSENVMRIVFNGKSDLLYTYKQLKSQIPAGDQAVLEKVMIGKKTSGWVSEFLDDYFRKASNHSSEFSVKVFKKYLAEGDNAMSMEKDFMKFFPELYSLIHCICDIMCL